MWPGVGPCPNRDHSEQTSSRTGTTVSTVLAGRATTAWIGGEHASGLVRPARAVVRTTTAMTSSGTDRSIGMAAPVDAGLDAREYAADGIAPALLAAT